MRLGAGQALGAQLGCAGRARGAQMGAGTAWACWGAQGGVRVRGARGRMLRVCGARRSRRRQGAGRRRARELGQLGQVGVLCTLTRFFLARFDSVVSRVTK